MWLNLGSAGSGESLLSQGRMQGDVKEAPIIVSGRTLEVSVDAALDI